MFDLGRIAAANLVARIDYHESLGSTSDRALELAAEGAAELPLLVLAQRQTAGRGRGANRWWTSDGALTFSLVLSAPPELLPLEDWPLVALVAGLAVSDALSELMPRADLRLKWPNDVFLGGRKLGGILSESVPGWRDRLVVGIGINVNNRVQGSGFRVQDGGESESGFVAASMIELDGVMRDLTDVLIAVLDHFDRRWHELLRGEQEPLIATYQQRCFLSGKTVTIEQPGGKLAIGVCLGIDRRGQLQLRTDSGPVSIASGTVASWDSG